MISVAEQVSHEVAMKKTVISILNLTHIKDCGQVSENDADNQGIRQNPGLSDELIMTSIHYFHPRRSFNDPFTLSLKSSFDIHQELSVLGE